MTSKRFSALMCFGGFAFGLGAMWWWALLGMSRPVGVASTMTTLALTTLGFLGSLDT